MDIELVLFSKNKDNQLLCCNVGIEQAQRMPAKRVALIPQFELPQVEYEHIAAAPRHAFHRELSIVISLVLFITTLDPYAFCMTQAANVLSCGQGIVVLPR